MMDASFENIGIACLSDKYLKLRSFLCIMSIAKYFYKPTCSVGVWRAHIPAKWAILNSLST